TRSRMVFLYSARLRRRMVTRPGSRPLVQSTCAVCVSIHFRTRSTSAAVGLARSAGGMSPERRFWATFSQILGCFRAAAWVLKGSSDGPPRSRLWLWQVVQYLARTGATSWANVVLGGAFASLGGWAEPSARGRARVRKKTATRDEPSNSEERRAIG